MIYAKFDDNGFAVGFWVAAACSDPEAVIPTDAVVITEEQHLEFLENAGGRKFIDGEVVVVEPSTVPATILDYENAIQTLVDGTARERQFRDGVTLASYTASTKPKWAAEAQAFVAWRDNVWTYAYGELAKVQAGQRQQPTVEQFLGEIARIAWPVA
ncbi:MULTISPECIES: hypothetical protein [Agrobacterium tumefaciens complex]|jgi:hypothetical protein|uniref:hypothetical protein n=1 Tax=Agrobacterium tumefaciens complex TaxID=1183400 RepID=UPI00185440B5|nr:MULTISPECIES: hypothetical protein [Agrobacterium tumefaciens complex]MBB4406874.1 hypothetical protein [Agrobacterium radiobacter]MBB4452922.1 hypothetical protein [Agrobacterium radiobacter]MDP9875486.1 hypothetical protein [Agrobacterium tumefaciens]MDP9980404.1 hypothetical protein [Agrobacterium tumefaciens]